MTFEEITSELQNSYAFYGHENLIKLIVELGGITHILSTKESIAKHGYSDQFNHFNDDDWDYLIVGNHRGAVVEIAEMLYVCDYDIREFAGVFFAVTYHA